MKRYRQLIIAKKGDSLFPKDELPNWLSITKELFPQTGPYEQH